MTKNADGSTPGPDTAGGEAGAATDEGQRPETPPRPTAFQDRLKEIQEADDDTLQEEIQQRAARSAGIGDDDDEGEEGPEEELEDELEEDDDAEGDRVREDEEDEDDGGIEEEGERESDDDDDEEGERGADEPEGDEEGERDDEVDGYLVLDLPARREGDPDFQLPVDVELLTELGIDPEEARERVAQLRNGYAYRREAEEIVAGVEQDKEDLDLLYSQLEEKPAEFILSSVDPKIRTEIVDDLVLELDDDAFQGLLDQMDKWARNPEARETARTKRENERLVSERDTEKAMRVRRQLNAQLREINKSIRALVPETMNARLAGAFRAEAAGELQKHVKENNLKTLDPAEVPGILADRGVLEAFGVSENGDASSTSDSDPEPPAKKRRDGKRKPSKRAAGKKGKTTDVRERLKRRKSAASTPAGAGSAAASAGFKKVPGERHDDRMGRLRKFLNLPPKRT